MSLTARIFISNARDDLIWCRAFVEALRWAGADVSYGEQRPFAWSEEAERDLASRAIFIVVLSPSAVIAREVQAAVASALARQTPSTERLCLGVVAQRCELPARWSAVELLSGSRGGDLTPAEAAARVAERLADAATRLPPALAATTPGPGEVARATWERGEFLRTQQQPDEALALYERALAANANQALLWYGLGTTLVDLKRHTDALQAFDRAVTCDPALAAAWYAQGQVFAFLGAHPEAIEAFERAVSINVALAPAWVGLGDTLGIVRRYADAVDAYEHALAADDTQAPVWNRKGNMLRMLQRQSDVRQSRPRGLGGMRQGAPSSAAHQWPDEALEAYERAVALDPHFALAWNNLIQMLDALDWEEEASDARARRDQALDATQILPSRDS